MNYLPRLVGQSSPKRAVQRPLPPAALSALSELCEIYWRPLCAFLRKQGYGSEEAQDLIQGFFAHLIESRAYAHAVREKGRFRDACHA